MLGKISLGNFVSWGLVFGVVAGCAAKADNPGAGTVLGSGGAGASVMGGTNPGGTGGSGTTPGTSSNGTGAGTNPTPGTGGASGGTVAGPVTGSGGASGPSGTGGMSGTITGSAGSGAAGSGMTGMYVPPCTTKASQVVILGDSYLNWGTHTFGADLAKEAGETWRMSAVGGFSMGSGGIGLIPPEFDQAVTADPDIKAVVMDGGGNDILIPAATWIGGTNCKNETNAATDSVCQMIIKTAFDAATTLMNHMADSGVKDIVYIFYPHVPDGTLLGGTHPNASLDYALPMAKALCSGAEQMTSGKLRCYFLDLVPIFDNHPEYFAASDVHENPMGSAAMAKAVWQIMTDHCIAQKSSSGCCMP